MNLLSIQTGHNATVGLMINGRIASLLSQEKVDNVKNSSVFPTEAIRAILDQNGLDAKSIDEVVIASQMIFPQHCVAPGKHEEVSDHLNPPCIVQFAKRLEEGLLGVLFSRIFQEARARRHATLRKEGMIHLQNRLRDLNLIDKPLSFIEHHECHARGAYHALEREHGRESLVFTLDGMGDGLCATVTRIGHDGKWTRLAETKLNASLGSIYSETTRFLGMKVMEHEYKVMGLAAYNKGYQLKTYQEVFEPILAIDSANPLAFCASLDTSKFYEYLVRRAVGERFDNVAGALQHLLEERVTQWIRNAISATGKPSYSACKMAISPLTIIASLAP